MKVGAGVVSMQRAMTKMMNICSSAHNVSLSFTIDVPTYPLTKLFALRYKEIENTIKRCVDIPKDLPDRCRKRIQHDDIENNENINIL